MEEAGSESYWKSLSERITNPGETKNKRPDTSDLEIEFLSKYVKSKDTVFDIGSGSGLIVNKLLPLVSSITAVEKFEGFTKFIVDDPNMHVINADILGFKMRKTFDVALSMGVSQCFNSVDTLSIYKNLFDMVTSGGYLIVRMHCGVEKGKVVNGYSEELGTNYFADYRFWKDEIDLLEKAGFHSIERHDVLPDELNVWPDTRHYIFTCKK